MADDDLSFTDVMEFAEQQAAKADDEFDGVLSSHASEKIVRSASDLLETMTNMKMMEALDDVEDPSDDEVATAFAKDAVEILMALGLLKYEYDVDIESEFAARKEALELIEDVDSAEELMEAIEEIDGLSPEDIGLGGPQPGDSVDRDGYNPNGVDKTFQ